MFILSNENFGLEYSDLKYYVTPENSEDPSNFRACYSSDYLAYFTHIQQEKHYIEIFKKIILKD